MIHDSFITRLPAVAGTFYPSDPEILGKLLDELLGQVVNISEKGDLKILISPHAGLEYSGKVAAWGFKQIEGMDIERVILLGVSHSQYFHHAAVYPPGCWVTPLGKVLVTEAAVGEMIDGEMIIPDPAVHDHEHTLEMQLIYLQKILKDFEIVPILVSNVSMDLCNELATKMKNASDGKTIIVVSSDLSHYPSYELAVKADEATICAIENGNTGRFQQTVTGLEGRYDEMLETAACGQAAISVAIKTAELSGGLNIKKISYKNSGDVTGDKTKVVGYGAIGFYTKD